MKAPSIEVNIDKTHLVSIDGIGEFISPLGTFHRRYGPDADPLVEWGERSKRWIGEIRRKFGERLRHVAVASKYPYGKFPEIPALCVDDTYRHVLIDDEHSATKITKHESDATTSKEFIEKIWHMASAVLIGTTTTTCIDISVEKLIYMMYHAEIPLQRIIMARDGVASQKSRRRDERRILNRLEREDNIIVVPRLEDIRWFIPPDISKQPAS